MISRMPRWNCRKDIGRFWVLDWKKSGQEVFLTFNRAMEMYNWQSGAQIRRNWSLCVQNISVLSRGIRKKNRGYESIHFSGDSTNTQNSCSTPCNSSAQYSRSSSELVSSVRLDRGREGKNQFICGHFLTTVPLDEVQFLASLPTNASEKQFARKHSKFQSRVQQNPFPEVVRRRSLWTPCFSLVEV